MNPIGLCSSCQRVMTIKNKSRALCFTCYNKIKVEVCVNCRRTKRIKGGGLCSACWNYNAKHGHSRPLILERKVKICSDCKSTKAVRNGRCKLCDDFRKRNNGAKRPTRFVNRQNLHCRNANCRKPLGDLPQNKGYCLPCRSYLLSNGCQRPLRFCRNLPELGYSRVCKNPHCGRPISDRGKRGGYCCGCHKWRRDNGGQDRPRHLCPQAVPFGWCDCGEIAVQIVTIRVPANGTNGAGAAEELRLCGDCLKEFR